MVTTAFGREHGWELQMRRYDGVYPARWVVAHAVASYRERDASDEEIVLWNSLPSAMTREGSPSSSPDNENE